MSFLGHMQALVMLADAVAPRVAAPRIVVTHVAPPIPTILFDYCAHDDRLGADASPIGWGATPQDAEADLRAQLDA